MVSTEKNQARRFQYGLNLELQRYVISFRYKTFAEVLTATREQEPLSDLMRKVPTGSINCPVGQIYEGTLTRKVDATLPKRQMISVPRFRIAVCAYCHKTRHTKDQCRLAHSLCLAYGSSKYRISQYSRSQPILG